MKKEVVVRSPFPFYLAGFAWLLYSLLFPFYRFTDFLIAAALSALAFYAGGKAFAPRREVVEVEETFASSGDRQADEMIAKGQSLLKDIRGANDRINHPELSDKITRLEDICRQIFNEIQRRPHKAPVIRRSLEYYLPVVLKLLHSYDSMEGQKVQGDTIQSTMAKIEGIMDTVLAAFHNQLDGLFKNDALDISTDITVLQGMLAQEGLLPDEISEQRAAEMKQ